MARSGPAPRPAPLKLLEGRSPGRDSGGRPVPAVPGFVRDAPELPPEWFPAAARAEWDRVVPELMRVQLLKPIDRAALMAYCMTVCRLEVAYREWLEDTGGTHVTGTNSQGRVRHPTMPVIDAATRELRALAAEFGLTPSAEQRVASPEGGGGGPDNPFAAGTAG